MRLRGVRRLVLLGLTGLLWMPLSARSELTPSTPSHRAVEAIRLLESPDPYERQLGFLRLEALREPSTVEAIERYVAHPDPEVRAESLRALAAIQGLVAAPRLLQALKTDRHPVVRRAALLGLEPLVKGHPDILPACLKALRDRSTEVRITAVDMVSRIDDPAAREAIRLRNKREGRRDVRRVLDLAMRRLAHNERQIPMDQIPNSK